MQITKTFLNNLVLPLVLLVIGILFTGDNLVEIGFCKVGGVWCAVQVGASFGFGLITVGLVADGTIWVSKFLFRKTTAYINSFGEGKIAFDIFEELLDSGEKTVGLIVLNREWFHDMHKFEFWLDYLRSNDLLESNTALKSINEEIGRLKTRRLKWREGDTKNNGLINIQRRNGSQKLLIAETDSKNNSLSLKFSEMDISDIPPGVYQAAMGGKGVMKNRTAGLYAWAIQITYTGNTDLHIHPIPLKEAGMHIIGTRKRRS